MNRILSLVLISCQLMDPALAAARPAAAAKTDLFQKEALALPAAGATDYVLKAGRETSVGIQRQVVIVPTPTVRMAVDLAREALDVVNGIPWWLTLIGMPVKRYSAIVTPHLILIEAHLRALEAQEVRQVFLQVSSEELALFQVLMELAARGPVFHDILQQGMVSFLMQAPMVAPEFAFLSDDEKRLLLRGLVQQWINAVSETRPAFVRRGA